MGQQQSNGCQAHVLERSDSAVSTNDTKTTGIKLSNSAPTCLTPEADLEQMVKDLDAFEMAVTKVKDHLSKIDAFLEGSIDAMIDGVGEVRKLHDEVKSLDTKDKAFQKLQKQAEMFERSALGGRDERPTGQ
ncbi:hypothetical protein FLAG1_03322 [Fusarium langsethiae]|uniref:Uncharacterized protein n=1 Tax=Fusarium langsethiae TaxID=179993 RepID=A0A0M9F0Z7_FUSLA|nr:hypothetical protein FLAG1_03322 [Fusarium langsethiae]GKU01147.1 unnamed protein product [Fusarium langsethiae]GKU12702.1 unnamed protein product [Fusarium langsethiae]